jgi:hypothetical protein
MIAKENFTATLLHFDELLQASMHRSGQQRTDSKREESKAGKRGQERFDALNDRSHTLPLQPQAAGEDRDDTCAMERSICTAQPLRLRGTRKNTTGRPAPPHILLEWASNCTYFIADHRFQLFPEDAPKDGAYHRITAASTGIIVPHIEFRANTNIISAGVNTLGRACRSVSRAAQSSMDDVPST